MLNYHKSSQSGETLVKVDLSTTNNVDLAKLKFVFEQNLSQNQIGSYKGQRASENWWRIIPKPGKMKNKAIYTVWQYGLWSFQVGDTKQGRTKSFIL